MPQPCGTSSNGPSGSTPSPGEAYVVGGLQQMCCWREITAASKLQQEGGHWFDAFAHLLVAPNLCCADTCTWPGLCGSASSATLSSACSCLRGGVPSTPRTRPSTRCVCGPHCLGTSYPSSRSAPARCSAPSTPFSHPVDPDASLSLSLIMPPASGLGHRGEGPRQLRGGCRPV